MMMKQVPMFKTIFAFISFLFLGHAVAQDYSPNQAMNRVDLENAPRSGDHAGEILQVGAPNLQTALLPPSFASYSEQCKISVLRKLGWQVNNTRAETAAETNYHACSARSTDDIVARGLLQLELPVDAQQRSAAIDHALAGDGSLCGYKQFYNPAFQRASRDLKENHSYSFDSIFGSGYARLGWVRAWRRSDCDASEKCYVPADHSIDEALTNLETSTFASECGTGIQLAEYLAIDHLFGPTEIEKYFKSKEIFVADWVDEEKSASVIHGKTGRRIFDSTGQKYASLGYQAFVGVPGYIGSLYPENYLDDLTNVNENFVIASATQEGADTFLKNGGQVYYFKFLKKIWEVSHGASKSELRALQALAADPNPDFSDTKILKKLTTPADGAGKPALSTAIKDLAQMLQDSFLTTTLVYVHPSGMKSFTWHIIRLAQINSRTPYSISFYAEATHAEIFDRWLTQQLSQCQEEGSH